MIETDGHAAKIDGMKQRHEIIDMEGVLLYKYISHCEDYEVYRLKSMEEAEAFV